MILVNVSIAHDERELSWLGIGDMSNHVSEASVTCDVERYAQSEITRALIHLTAETFLSTLCFRRRDEELAEHVAWRESHERQICRVPCAQQDSAVGRIGLDEMDDFL